MHSKKVSLDPSNDPDKLNKIGSILDSKNSAVKRSFQNCRTEIPALSETLVQQRGYSLQGRKENEQRKVVKSGSIFNEKGGIENKIR